MEPTNFRCSGRIQPNHVLKLVKLRPEYEFLSDTICAILIHDCAREILFRMPREIKMSQVFGFEPFKKTNILRLIGVNRREYSPTAFARSVFGI